jgi:hypothetical protein
MLQIAVLLRTTTNGKSLQAQAFTQVVNAHGGLLESPLELTAGQRITLIDPQSGLTVNGKVVRTEKPSDSSYAIAFEFDKHSPQFWPISFPPEDWGVAQEAATENR